MTCNKLILGILFFSLTWVRAEIPLQQINELIAEGRFTDAAVILKAAAITAKGEERQKIDKMLSQLGGYIAERRTAGALIPRPGPTDDGTYAVTHLGGFKGSWMAVGTRDSIYSTQRTSGFTTTFPQDWIEREWAEELHITALSGDADGWCVVMSRRLDQATPKQAYKGPAPVDDAMLAWIREKNAAGYRITTVGGFLNQWVVVMTADTGWGAQRYIAPGKPDAGTIRKWWQEREAEGYSITSLNGDFTIDSQTQERTGTSFMIVATQGLEIDRQFLEVDVDFPKGGTINTEHPVLMIAGYKTNNLVILRGGFPFVGSRQMIGEDADCEKLINRVWHEFHLKDAIAKEKENNTEP